MPKPTPVPFLFQKKLKVNQLYKDERKKFPYRPAELKRPKSGALDKRWSVCFWIWSERKSHLERMRFSVDGDTINERKKFASHLIKEINKVLEDGAYIDPADQLPRDDSFPLVVALDKYLQIKKATLKKQSFETYEKWTRYLVAYLEFYKLEEISLNEFDPSHADKLRTFLLQREKIGNKTYNSIKGFLSGFLNDCKKLYGLQRNVISETLTTLPTKTSKHRSYNKVQIQEYQAQCEKLDQPNLWFFVRFIYYTFMRPNFEARLVQVGDIKDKTIVIYADNSKTNHRHVMIPQALEDIFTEMDIRNYPPHFYLFGHENKPGPKPVGRVWMYDRHVKVLTEMELKGEGYDLYGWKHTGVIALYNATKNLMLVRDQCGHSDISQTVQYLRDLGVFHYTEDINKFPAI